MNAQKRIVFFGTKYSSSQAAPAKETWRPGDSQLTLVLLLFLAYLLPRYISGAKFWAKMVIRELEHKRFSVKRGTLPSTLHVLRMGTSVLCNPTGLADNKRCVVAFPSEPLLRAVQIVLSHCMDITETTTDKLLDHIDQLKDVDGIFEVEDCYCMLCNQTTYYHVTQVESRGDDAIISNRIVELTIRMYTTCK